MFVLTPVDELHDHPPRRDARARQRVAVLGGGHLDPRHRRRRRGRRRPGLRRRRGRATAAGGCGSGGGGARRGASGRDRAGGSARGRTLPGVPHAAAAHADVVSAARVMGGDGPEGAVTVRSRPAPVCMSVSVMARRRALGHGDGDAFQRDRRTGSERAKRAQGACQECGGRCREHSHDSSCGTSPKALEPGSPVPAPGMTRPASV